MPKKPSSTNQQKWVRNALIRNPTNQYTDRRVRLVRQIQEEEDDRAADCITINAPHTRNNLTTLLLLLGEAEEVVWLMEELDEEVFDKPQLNAY